jgi:phosphotransferase system  glucose/maltose/N-acetylglucosamine-specific IIC component
MSAQNAAFALLQKTGKALMLPVSVLPVAGLLLGLGSAHFAWLPPALSDVMAQALPSAWRSASPRTTASRRWPQLSATPCCWRRWV